MSKNSDLKPQKSRKTTLILTTSAALQLETKLPHLDREVLLAHVLKRDRVWLMTHPEERLTRVQEKKFRSLLACAKRQKPIAYLVGEKEFYGRNFSVGPGALIPRPETELLVEHALNRVGNLELRMGNKKKRIALVDVGTGSGCIIISLAKELSSQFKIQNSRFSFFAVDSEEAALRYARKNTKRLHTGTAIRFMKSDILSRLRKKLSGYDTVYIVANLPYLSNTLYRSTAPNVKRYEPKSALLSGKDGLDHYRRLLAELCTLNTAGVKVNFFLEISQEQVKKLTTIFAGITTLSSLEIIPDIAGRSRLVIGVLENSQNKSPAYARLL